MEKTLNVKIETAREWYNSENDALKAIAEQVFTKEELLGWPTSVKEAFDKLGLDSQIALNIEDTLPVTAATMICEVACKAINPKKSGKWVPYFCLDTRKSKDAVSCIYNKYGKIFWVEPIPSYCEKSTSVLKFETEEQVHHFLKYFGKYLVKSVNSDFVWS